MIREIFLKIFPEVYVIYSTDTYKTDIETEGQIN